ncbi:23S rRNA (adenine(2030)-N(6))-methyltransferase RlmJ [Kingella kingae]|uniref:23S rRNA (adenine(2030)-N(6))-methyltransferase RlmJ n=1 Tax=Kingella kingae TaxID=504 RepID=UPI000411BCA3|nr:23S rRNA (adenine(2030)-N(6))-methyltransferase RlmJ [Kingella kingae]MDK4545554.1 23S rRNA (adenine(2030)-N(6))-methyltransferase RlmJ [Kingella kingae]MDK4567497.1 23S rRNA (adenine(2030)-N(6))-methyltransferase RlmJ [Kingella kingae]MDK4591188.1 23S rRNA (adenine(2030)-N(6))-methyltransferase RlmJ [Kingella kingae]MDK4629296.1 23S rRNA (adenine(2030)-N(6))-methyltransferase RlmJ [Kingella kingae]MDK4637208.1 23S rRNA (adenine(2030)-N(6))-methyltransferase RlmJ [Kingella kingae]
MLSYRHAFHAGNHADVLKHFILYAVLDYFNQKDKAYWYIDTHSGAGLYDLHGEQAQKVGEFADGIAKLQAAGNLSAPVQDFVDTLQHILPAEHLYAGSPWWAQSLLREADKLRLFELHPADFGHLTQNMREAKLGRRGIIKQEDGFAGLLSLLPPITRRAMVLIDPPYEQKQDYARVVQTLKDALKRFEQGCYMVWYPCLSRAESVELPKKLKKLSRNYVQAALHVHTPRADGFGMHGSGIFIINPPYVLPDLLRDVLPELTRLLAQDSGAKFELDYCIA